MTPTSIRWGFAAGIALLASVSSIGWLIKSSVHPDRPPMFAIAALLFALGSGATGVALARRAVTGMMRATGDTGK